MRFWTLQVLLALDQLLNTVLGGWSDETISARAWRLHQRKRRWAVARLLIDALFMLIGQRNHCQDAYISERERKHMPLEHRRPY
ncbi:MAG: hypothetical protein QG602_1217 [Verrucomicrobiota bacterium]|nr:hypothetical protein [Verrucomicrobiota bacterium]